jgi:hypothetical protein
LLIINLFTTLGATHHNLLFYMSSNYYNSCRNLVTLYATFVYGPLNKTQIKVKQDYWSALAIAPAETSAQAKVASNSTDFFLFSVLFFLSPTIELPLLGKLGS